MLKIPISPQSTEDIAEIRTFIQTHCSIETQIDLQNQHLAAFSQTEQTKDKLGPHRTLNTPPDSAETHTKTVIKYAFGDTDISREDAEESVIWLQSHNFVFELLLSFDDIS